MKWKISKKIICLLICCGIIVGGLVPVISLYKKHKIEKAALETGMAVAKMCRENDAPYQKLLEKSDAQTVEIPNRLVVETDSVLDLPDDAEVVYGNDFAYVQCDDEESAEDLKRSLDKDGFDVCNDYVAKVISDNNDYPPVYEYPTGWAYERVESDAANSQLTVSQKSKRINIMVVDTGINYNHAGLIPRVTEHSVNLSSSGNSNSAKDDQGHGTKVAGVIVKTTPGNVKLQAVKLMDDHGRCTLSEFLSALNYLTSLSDPPDIINMSFGFPSSGMKLSVNLKVRDLCRSIVNAGTVGVCSAGNDAKHIDSFPAECSEFITVAASDYGNDMADFSNYNSTGDTDIDIAAPGVEVNTYQMSSYTEAKVDGTSFSSPLVAAGAAIVMMQDSDMTNYEVADRLCERAMPFKVHWSGIRYGWGGAGILNMYNLIDGDRVGNIDYEILSEKIDYSDMKVSLSCEEENTTIYYTTDGTRPSKSSTVYSEPIELTKFTRIFAVAYSNSSSKKLHSYYMVAELAPRIMTENDSSVFELDDRNYITKYKGKKTSLAIDTVGRFAVRGIAEGAFENSNVKYLRLSNSIEYIEKNAFKNSDIEEIVTDKVSIFNINYPSEERLINDPETYESSHYGFDGVHRVDESAFEGCKNLRYVNFPNLLIIGRNAFKDCTSLAEMPILFGTVIKDGAFMNTGLKSISIPYCNNVPDNAFKGCAAETISVPKAKSVGTNAFESTKLRNVDLSSVEHFTGENNFVGCTNLTELDLPNSDNLPSFSFDSEIYYAPLKHIYAPKATEFCGGKSNLSPMINLKYIYAPSLRTIAEEVSIPKTMLFSTSHLEYARTH